MQGMAAGRPAGERRERSGRRVAAERRDDERRFGERRLQNMWVAVERRAGAERRRRDRRAGRDRRRIPDRRHPMSGSSR